jgi:Cleaved Adhesin Domain
MARLTLLKTTPLLLGILGLAACPGDDVPADTEGTSSGGEDSTTMGPVTPTTTTIDPDSASGEVSSGSSSDTTDPTTGGPMCEPECPMGECCLGGNCFAAPAPTCDGGCGENEDCVCPDGMDPCDCVGECVPSACGIDGNYDPCFGVECEAGYICLVDNVANPTISWCALEACGTACDCPVPPEGFEASCEDLIMAGSGQCFIACDAGACPEGMECIQDSFCVWPAPGVEPVPQYGDCLNGGTCDTDLVCVTDGMTFGWCGTLDCADDAACEPPPATGDAPPACIPVNMGMNTVCSLDCSMGQTCPDGMSCVFDSVCAWEPPPPPPGDNYGDCFNNPGSCEPGEDACLDDGGGMPTAGACSQSGCAVAADCPVAPPTGAAVVACGDFGDGNTCYLDCSMGEACPDGMACTAVGMGPGAGMACLWPEAVAVAGIDEDFEGGALPAGWTVINVDGLVPAAPVAFVNAAWVVDDAIEAGANFAAYSTSWYNPAGQSDDWLVTPQVTLGATATLSWDAQAPDAAFPDGYEVRISTAGNTVMDFMANPTLFTIANEADVFTARMVDLAAAGYANQDVYIAFRNNSNDEFLLLVDNVVVAN